MTAEQMIERMKQEGKEVTRNVVIECLRREEREKQFSDLMSKLYHEAHTYEWLFIDAKPTDYRIEKAETQKRFLELLKSAEDLGADRAKLLKDFSWSRVTKGLI